jgi:hypothetical protein
VIFLKTQQNHDVWRDRLKRNNSVMVTRIKRLLRQAFDFAFSRICQGADR